jgi:uncharacterized protein (DUF1501 family)
MSTLLNLKLANKAVAQDLSSDDEDRKTLVCLFLNGGIDSFNLLVPRDTERYREYATTRTNLALPQGSLLPLNQTVGGDGKDYGLHPATGGLQTLFNGPDPNRRLTFITNIGTLVEPMTMRDYQEKLISRPLGLYSHSDQRTAWQTSLPLGDVQLTGWAGRVADVLHDTSNAGSRTSMSISLAGNNVFQVGRNTQQFVMTSKGTQSLSAQRGGDHPTTRKNIALRSLMEQEYASLMEKAFAELTIESLEQQEAIQEKFDALQDNFASVTFPDSSIGREFLAALKTISLRQDLGLRRQTIFLSDGGWDHHSALIQPQQDKLSDLTPAITAFQTGLENLGLADSVITFSASDFARTLRSNGSGSDHAWGGNSFIIGGPVAGGRVLGRYPSLALNSPDDVGRGGRILPTLSVDSLFAELLLWFGLEGRDHFERVLPNLANFYDIATADPADPSSLPIGFLKPNVF